MVKSDFIEKPLVIRGAEELVDANFSEISSWVSPEILPYHGVLLFGGAAKIGKSFMMLELGLSIALGQAPFNHPELSVSTPAKILIVEQELGERTMQKRLSWILKKRDPNRKYWDNIKIISKEPRLQLSTVEGLSLFDKIIDRSGCNVLILDPISKLHGYNENDNTEIARLVLSLELLRKKYEDRGLSIVYSHHYGKPLRGSEAEGFDNLDPYNFRGASKWFDDSDTLITVHKTKEHHSPHFWWTLACRWTLRHGSPINECVMSVNEHNDGRVLFKADSRHLTASREDNIRDLRQRNLVIPRPRSQTESLSSDFAGHFR